MSKLRDDSKWNRLTPEQREKLEEWLFEENLGYAKTLKRVKEQFGLEATISSLGRYYRRRAQERQMEEFLDAQEIAYQAKDLPLNVPVMREGLVRLLYKAALKLAVEKPGEVAELAAVMKLLLASEDNEIRRARQKLAERYFDYDAVADCQKESRRWTTMKVFNFGKPEDQRFTNSTWTDGGSARQNRSVRFLLSRNRSPIFLTPSF